MSRVTDRYLSEETCTTTTPSPYSPHVLSLLYVDVESPLTGTRRLEDDQGRVTRWWETVVLRGHTEREPKMRSDIVENIDTRSRLVSVTNSP